LGIVRTLAYRPADAYEHGDTTGLPSVESVVVCVFRCGRSKSWFAPAGEPPLFD
jgi:hypothetical protein